MINVMDMVMIVIALIIGVLIVVVAALALWSWQRTSRYALRRRVLINKVDGSAISGVLWQRTGRLLIVRHASVLERGSEPHPADGELIIDRDMIDFVQVMP